MNKVGDLLAEFDLGFGTPYQVIDILIPIIVGYIIYIGYIYCYIIVVASQGSDGSILEKPEQDDCGKLCRTSVSAEPVRIKLEKRIYNNQQHITNSNRDWRLCKCLQETNGQTVGSALARPGSLEKGLVPP
jgi:hypothetical protein